MESSIRDTCEQYEDPIFIERNGYRFQYVLDYMRDGNTISLLDHIRKEVL
jgi:BTB/POZ domain